MPLIVQKYGGTSVGSAERIQAVAERVILAKKAGDDVIVVLSAMSGETDRLMGLAHKMSPMPDEREMDMLLSTGERVTIALLAMALRERGYPARSFTGRQVGIITDAVHTKARIERVTGERMREALAEGVIPVVAGFQGINEKSDVTTLGRGGSDTTAVALAAALKADRCDIYTDVDGVYTTDPNIVPNARRLDKISYEEMLEILAAHEDRFFGARVDAEAAEHAAQQVDLEAGGILLDLLLRTFAGLDVDALSRAHRSAHVAGDTLGRAVLARGQKMHSAVAARNVPLLLGVLDGGRTTLHKEGLEHIAQGEPHPVNDGIDTGMGVSIDGDDAGGHGGFVSLVYALAGAEGATPLGPTLRWV